MDASESDTMTHLVLGASIPPTMTNKQGAGKIFYSPPKFSCLQVAQVKTLCMTLYRTP